MMHKFRSSRTHDETRFQLGFVFLFPLHASVLEPDLDLSLGEAQCMSDLDPAPTRQVAVEMKFFF
ncbi:hypothetical protein X975_14348, partial [Stegodyphus mimosarum]